MCSYSAINGAPSCANSLLLNDVLRTAWRQPDALVVTDCKAVQNLRGPPVQAPSDAAAAAMALMNGTDIELGSELFLGSLEAAVRQGLASEARVGEAVRRWLLPQMRAGRFDAPGPGNPHAGLTTAALNSSAHQQVLEAASK